MKKFVFLLLIAGIMSLRGGATPAGAQGQTRLVLAFYYAWFNTGSFGPGKTPFQPIQPYNSSDPATIQRHVAEAQAAGIDGFVQSWYGPSDPYTNGNFQTLLNTASTSGFRAAVDFEPAAFYGNHDERAAGITYLLNNLATHPAYLRVDGRPVIFFWANWLYSVEDWGYIRNLADPNHSAIWIAEGAHADYLSVFDGLHFYNTSWADAPGGVAANWGNTTRAATTTYGSYKYWVATAMPGFDETLLGRSGYRDRAGGAYYQTSFSGAAASSPDMLIITSYNEWPEGSNIEPSVEFGNYYLDLTAQMSAAYKSGSVPPPGPQPTAGPSPTPAPSKTAGPSPTPKPSATATPLPTPLASPTAQADGSIIYYVVSGDTLTSIANRFQLELQDLYALNNLTGSSIIGIGQAIVLGYDSGRNSAIVGVATEPANVREDGAIIHPVAVGETLLGISVAVGLTLPELLTLNPGLSENSLLQVGQEIVIGYLLQPESVGGSTDLPIPTPIFTVTPSPSSEPTPLPTTTALPLPSPTATEAATIVADLSQATAPSPSPPQVTPQTTPLPTVPLILLGLALILTLVGVGALFVYLGRR